MGILARARCPFSFSPISKARPAGRQRSWWDTGKMARAQLHSSVRWAHGKPVGPGQAHGGQSPLA